MVSILMYIMYNKRYTYSLIYIGIQVYENLVEQNAKRSAYAAFAG